MNLNLFSHHPLLWSTIELLYRIYRSFVWAILSLTYREQIGVQRTHAHEPCVPLFLSPLREQPHSGYLSSPTASLIIDKLWSETSKLTSFSLVEYSYNYCVGFFSLGQTFRVYQRQKVIRI